MSTPFRDKKEFRKVFDRAFEVLSRDERFGPPLRARKLPQRFVITDLKITLDVRDSDDKKAARGDHLFWTWNGEGQTWDPDVTLETTSELMNRYFQGKENMPMALLRGKAKITQGSPVGLLWTAPILHAFHPVWVEVMKKEGWTHLLA
ncbi:MAG: hypothetical protein IT186_25900 [Acidobacteria bacterium]|nr:hypothetical protein [Acidobacteriota bacterium]MCG3191485.1 hypothetical protein [Thermoanaerobaculia bacterium]MCK6681858.1 hypothetical protein [Thermoanaerobaculia bacterium]